MQAKQIAALIEPAISGLGFDMWGCEYLPQGKYSVLRVYIERPAGEGVTLDDCQEVSRHLGNLLDVEATIQGHYNLEVSSPGIERPLFRPAQYQRYIGQQIKLKTRRTVEGRRNFSGILQQVDVAAQHIVLQLPDQDEAVTLGLDDIDKAHLVSFVE